MRLVQTVLDAHPEALASARKVTASQALATSAVRGPDDEVAQGGGACRCVAPQQRTPTSCRGGGNGGRAASRSCALILLGGEHGRSGFAPAFSGAAFRGLPGGF